MLGILLFSLFIIHKRTKMPEDVSVRDAQQSESASESHSFSWFSPSEILITIHHTAHTAHTHTELSEFQTTLRKGANCREKIQWRLRDNHSRFQARRFGCGNAQPLTHSQRQKWKDQAEDETEKISPKICCFDRFILFF